MLLLVDLVVENVTGISPNIRLEYYGMFLVGGRPHMQSRHHHFLNPRAMSHTLSRTLRYVPHRRTTRYAPLCRRRGSPMTDERSAQLKHDRDSDSTAGPE
jgi:hypothetical protein